jgi:RNA polymerase sigma-70 factor (ECF subfamily)
MSESSSAEEAVVSMSRDRWGRREVEPDEPALIRAAQKGSPDALEALARRYWQSAYRVALVIVQDPYAAQDVAQEAILTAVRALDRFDRRRPFGPWLHRIVTNRAVDWVRARGRRSEVEFNEGVLSDRVDDRPAEVPEEGISDDLMAALRSLSAEDRAIVAMSHLVGFGSNEIARALGLTEGTVRSRLSRALSRLRAQLGEAGQPAAGDDAQRRVG